MNTAEATKCMGWFCLRAQARRERAAASMLNQRVGIDVFAPRIRVRATRSRGHLGVHEEPLFPGYVFARFRYPDQLRHVVSTTGIRGVVQFGQTTPIVADAVIEFLRAQVRLADGPSPLIEQGAWVKIVGGCFRENEGRVISVDSKTDRVRVLLTLLGRDIQVSVPARELSATGAQAPLYPPGLRAK